MKARVMVALLICGIFVLVWSTNKGPGNIKTDFAPDAHLSATDLRRVISLAKRSGITDVAKVSTFHYRPVGGRGISVESAERADGRNASFDSVTIHKTDWDQPIPSDGDVNRDGNFWCDAGSKPTTLS